MDTAYKTRAWWMLRALGYAESLWTEAGDYSALGAEQWTIYSREGDKAAANAVAPAGAECLTRRYVDRQGNTLPECRA